jgi:elongation factor P
MEGPTFRFPTGIWHGSFWKATGKPSQVELGVAYTEPGVRGDTASGAVTKPAKLETGLEIRVPFFIKEGERVKVSTETREFAGRA